MLTLVDRWSLVRFIHVMGAVFWIGGQLVLTATVIPVLRAALEPQHRRAVGATIGRRFAVAAYAVGLPVQIATGIALAAHRGVRWSSLTTPGYGATLGAKIVLVAVAVACAVGHGVAAARGNDALSRMLALAALATSIAIVVLATALVP